MSDLVIENMNNAEDAQFVVKGFMNMMTSATAPLTSIGARVAQLENEKKALEAQLQLVEASRRAAPERSSPTANLPPPPTVTPESIIAKRIIAANALSSSVSPAPQAVVEDDNPLGLSCAIEEEVFEDIDLEMKKPGATTVSKQCCLFQTLNPNGSGLALKNLSKIGRTWYKRRPLQRNPVSLQLQMLRMTILLMSSEKLGDLNRSP